jgi:hypothetical protein
MLSIIPSKHRVEAKIGQGGAAGKSPAARKFLWELTKPQ